MDVILLEDIKGVGKKGQVYKASDGYARNFLLPKKLAVEATKSNLNELEAKKKSLENKKQKELEEATQLKAKLEDGAIVIFVKTGENGKLFGSVTNIEVSAALIDQRGISIDRKKISLSDSIKSTGNYKALVKLSGNISANVTLEIKSKE